MCFMFHYFHQVLSFQPKDITKNTRLHLSTATENEAARSDVKLLIINKLIFYRKIKKKQM